MGKFTTEQLANITGGFSRLSRGESCGECSAPCAVAAWGIFHTRGNGEEAYGTNLGEKGDIHSHLHLAA